MAYGYISASRLLPWVLRAALVCGGKARRFIPFSPFSRFPRATKARRKPRTPEQIQRGGFVSRKVREVRKVSNFLTSNSLALQLNISRVECYPRPETRSSPYASPLTPRPTSLRERNLYSPPETGGVPRQRRGGMMFYPKPATRNPSPVLHTPSLSHSLTHNS